MQTYEGQPEFELLNRANFNVEDDSEMPQITYLSNTQLNELAPQQNEKFFKYQEYQPLIEDWAIFRQLPQIMRFDKIMNDQFKGVANGTVRVTEWTKITNPPSLFAYHSTMPQWCRNHSFITNVLFAMEFHQPRHTIREKEMALNYAASYMRPIDDRLLKVIKIIASAKKTRLNIELAKTMVNDLRFWPFEQFDVGDESDEEGEDDDDITKVLAKGIDEEENNDMTMADRMLALVTEDFMDAERDNLYFKELNVADFQVEPEVETCMTDFYRKPYAEIHEIQGVQAEVEHVQPVNFYDNDDGFWDEFIDTKRLRWQASPMIVNRQFIKH